MPTINGINRAFPGKPRAINDIATKIASITTAVNARPVKSALTCNMLLPALVLIGTFPPDIYTKADDE